MLEGLAKLLQNPMIIQYMAAAGQDIGSGNPIGTNVNQVTSGILKARSQDIKNKEYMQMLQQMMEKGGKVTMDQDKTKFDLPTRAFKGILGEQGTDSALDVATPGGLKSAFEQRGAAQQGIGPYAVGPPAPTPAPTPVQRQPNPFSVL